MAVRGITFGVLLGAGLLCPDLAAEVPDELDEPVEAVVAASNIAAEDPKVCKRIRPTGSRIVRRYCLPKSEWDAMRNDGQKAARDMIRDESQVRYQPNG